MPTKKKENVQGLKGSRASRKAVAAILEALSGEIGTAEAAELMGVSLSRYYQLEARALQGMLGAMEPKKRGIQKTPERAILGLEAEKKLLEKELRRHQSLLRAANRSLGLAKGGRKKASSAPKGRKRGARGKTVLKTLKPEAEGAGDGTAQRDVDVGGRDRSQRSGA